MIKSIQIGYDESFEKKCRFASEGGFRHIAVNFTKVLDKTEYEWDKVTEDVMRILEENKLECVQSHPYYYDLLLSSEISEERYEFAVKQAVKATGKLGGKWCALHPRSSITTGFSRVKSIEDNKRYVDDYLEYAEKYNTGIALENLPEFHGIFPVMPFYSCNYYDLIELCDSFKSDRVGICWDTGHANMMHFDQAQAIIDVGNRLKITHIHNNFKDDDLHNPPDSGNIEWDKVMASFKKIGYDGPFTLETHCLYPDDFMLKRFA